MIDPVQHLFISGITRSGKTFYAQKMFEGDLPLLKIYFDPKCSVKTKYARKVTNFESYKSKPETRSFMWHPAADVDGMVEQMQELVIDLIRMGKALDTERHWCSLYVDEIHLLAPKHKPSALDQLWLQGAGLGIKCIGITPRPSEASHTVITQSGRLVFFALSPFELNYFKTHTLNLEPYAEWVRFGSHQYVVYENGEILKYKKVVSFR